MLTTAPKRNPASNSNRSDTRPRPSEGRAQARRELQRRDPAYCGGGTDSVADRYNESKDAPNKKAGPLHERAETNVGSNGY
jgi:hypothetical protein